MKDEHEIRRVLKRIENDSRAPTTIGGKRGVATIQVNAPLALQQMAMEAAHGILLWVLGDRKGIGLGLEVEKDRRP